MTPPPHEPTVYRLPATDIPDAVRDSLHPWIAGFIGLTPALATERLHERWASIIRPSLCALRETLKTFIVQAIVDYQVGGMIYAVRPNSDEDEVGNSFFLLSADWQRTHSRPATSFTLMIHGQPTTPIRGSYGSRDLKNGAAR
jgi:hypothetical protein